MDTLRKDQFRQLLKKFNMAAKVGFDNLTAEVNNEMHIISSFTLPEVRQITNLNRIDQNSLMLYPKNDPLCKGYVPTLIYGDGNCLSRVGSMYVFGCEENHIEMRVRIIAEMVRNKNWYLLDSSKRQYAQFADNVQPTDNLKYITGVEAVFNRCVTRFTEAGQWGEMWHLMALANVLHCKVFSVYPDLIGTTRDHHLFHREIEPRFKKSSESIRIMWTTLSCNTLNDNWWSPNHFVACAEDSNQKTLSQGTPTPNRKRNFTLDQFIITKPKVNRLFLVFIYI